MRFWRTRSNKKQNLRRGISAGGFFESLEERQLMNAVFVAPWGNDSANGSVQAPVQSVQHAIDMAKPGDVITLRGGNYAGGINIDKGGLTIQSAPGERATISAPIDNEGVQNDVHLDLNASNIKLLNLDLSGGYYYAVKAESNWDTGAPSLQAANNILIQGCRIHDSGRDVIKLTPGTNNITIQGSEIFNSGQRDPSNAEGVDGVQTNNFTMRDSYIHNTTTNGIYIKGGSVNTLIERNRISDISQAGILLGQSSDENWFDTKVNPGYYESINGTVRNNIIWNTQGAGMGAWAALNAKFYNNTLLNVAESMQGGFLISSQEHWIPQDVYVPSTNVTMQNNIVQVNSNRPVFDIREGALTGSLVLGHNLYYAPGHGAQFWDERNNAVGNMAQWRAAYGDVGAMEADPKLDGSGHLQAGSPAIDAGAPVGGFGDDIDHQGRGAGLGHRG